jgi:hypothetical protein
LLAFLGKHNFISAYNSDTPYLGLSVEPTAAVIAWAKYFWSFLEGLYVLPFRPLAGVFQAIGRPRTTTLKDSGDSFTSATLAWNFWILAFFVFRARGARRVTGALVAVVFPFLAFAIASFVVVFLFLLFCQSFLL